MQHHKVNRVTGEEFIRLVETAPKGLITAMQFDYDLILEVIELDGTHRFYDGPDVLTLSDTEYRSFIAALREAISIPEVGRRVLYAVM
jgi:hypothetical protein